MAVSSLPYIPGFSVEFLVQPGSDGPWVGPTAAPSIQDGCY